MNTNNTTPTTKLYLYGEDFVPGLVGPFDTQEEVDAHKEFQRARGDAAVHYHEDKMTTMTEDEARDTHVWNDNRVTPEQDREFTPRCALAFDLTCAVAVRPNNLTPEELMLAAIAHLRSNDREDLGFDVSFGPQDDDAEALLDTGWMPSCIKYGVCSKCDGIMEAGDEFPAERVCMTCTHN